MREENSQPEKGHDTGEGTFPECKEWSIRWSPTCPIISNHYSPKSLKFQKRLSRFKPGPEFAPAGPKVQGNTPEPGCACLLLISAEVDSKRAC